MASGRQQCRVFNLIPWKQRNGITKRTSYRVMHIFFRKYTHKYMEHGVNFDVLSVHKLWSEWRGIKTESIFLRLCNQQLHFNTRHYFPYSNLSMCTQANLIDWWQTRNRPYESRFDVIVDTMILWVHDKGSCKSHEREPHAWLCFISWCILLSLYLASIFSP